MTSAFLNNRYGVHPVAQGGFAPRSIELARNPIGEVRRDALRVGYDRAIKLEFHGAKVSSDAGQFAYRDQDEAAQLTMRPDRVARGGCCRFPDR